jgi:hypothetical protein
MSQTTALNLLPQTIAVVTGDKQPGVSYYTSGKTLQTITWKLTAFLGTVVIQASLSENPTTDAEWFPIYNLVCTPGNNNGGTILIPAVSFVNITGNFAWVRAKVTTYTSGTINYIKVCY